MPDTENMIKVEASHDGNHYPPTHGAFAAKTLTQPSSKVYIHKQPNRDLLLILAAKLQYPLELEKWETHAPFDSNLETVGFEKPEFWFAYPEYNESQKQLEPKVLDSHHLFVNCRCRVCEFGFPGYGITAQAWWDVAKAYPSVISLVIVKDLIDKQSNALARKVFSEKVQLKMLELYDGDRHYRKEALFCHLIRNWYRAEDEKGISAKERAKFRLAFRKFLLEPVDLSNLPQYGAFVCGMPRQMFEGFLINIDIKLILYPLVKKGTMNVHAVGSLQNETLFSEMTDMEPTKKGCPKAVNAPRMMSSTTELQHYCHQPDKRNFSIRTSRNLVYPRTELEKASKPTGSDQEVSIFTPTYLH